MAEDYVSTLTGEQMDEALLDMAEHNSEAWAVGKRKGIDVPSTDETYQNNAKYYSEHAREITIGMESLVVDTLPQEGANNIRYLVPTGVQDVYEVFIWQASESDYLSLGQTSMTSQGDMLQSVYDPNEEVAEAGGIAEYVEANGGKVATVSVNGGTPIEPDEDKNIDLVIEGYMAWGQDKNIAFNADGSITETSGDLTRETVFNGNVITETVKKNGTTIKTKTTTFNNDGSISEVVL